MFKKSQRISALSRIIILDGMRRHALLGLLILALAAEAGGLLFFDFISRDIGRASSDFIFSINWLAGLIFLFFYAVQVTAWDEERGVIYALLSRPISRGEYVIGVFLGLGALLFSLNLILGILGWCTLTLIEYLVSDDYFACFSSSLYLLTWFGLVAMELMILSVISLFSGLVRGSFPVLLISIAFYAICSGLPVVRESVAQGTAENGGQNFSALLLQSMTAIFPDFERLDLKNYILSPDSLPGFTILLTNFSLVTAYILIMLWVACIIYKRRDLQ